MHTRLNLSLSTTVPEGEVFQSDASAQKALNDELKMTDQTASDTQR